MLNKKASQEVEDGSAFRLMICPVVWIVVVKYVDPGIDMAGSEGWWWRERSVVCGRLV